MASESIAATPHQTLLALLRDTYCEGNMAELGRRISKDASYVARLFYPAEKKGAKGIGLEIMSACNGAFSLPPGFWDMTTEEAARALAYRVSEDVPPYVNPTPGANATRVPVISWVRAGSFETIEDLLAPGEAIGYVEVDKPVGPHTFALVVEGDSMINDSGKPSFPENTIIAVDPDKGAAPGSFVVAKNVATQKATFKKYMTDGFTTVLRALNNDKSAYPDIVVEDANIRIIATLTWSRLVQDF